jgi:hypothetical protein
MKIIQSYNTFEGDPDRIKSGFPTLRALKSFLKKSYQVHKNFDFEFYTDKDGYEVIKDIIEDKHIKIFDFVLIDDRIPYIGKFQVQEIQKEP